RYADAEPLLQRAVAANERRLGPDHPDTFASEANLAVLYERSERPAEAEGMLRDSVSQYTARLRREPRNAEDEETALGIGRYYASLLAHLGADAPLESAGAGVLAVQLGRFSAAGAALAAAAGRLESRDPAIGARVRERDAATSELRSLETQ